MGRVSQLGQVRRHRSGKEAPKSSTDGKPVRKYKVRPVVSAMRLQNKLKMRKGCLFRAQPFERLVRAITDEVSRQKYGFTETLRFQKPALRLLQLVVEQHDSRILSNAALITKNRNKMTTAKKDIDLARLLCRDNIILTSKEKDNQQTAK